MLLRSARRRVAALRQPGPSARLARALWIAWAVIVWNVVFDHAIVVAGRSYIVAATRHTAADPTAPPLNIDEWMAPAVTRGLIAATAAAGTVLAAGLAAVSFAARRQLRIRNVELRIRDQVDGDSKRVGTNVRIPNS